MGYCAFEGLRSANPCGSLALSSVRESERRVREREAQG